MHHSPHPGQHLQEVDEPQEIRYPALRGFTQKRKLPEASTQITPKKTREQATHKIPVRTCDSQTSRTPVRVRTAKTAPTVKFHNKMVQSFPHTADKETQISTAPVHIDMIRDSNKLVRQYTGLADYTLFMILHRCMTAKCEEEQCTVRLHQCNPEEKFKFMSTENQMLLVLCKLKTNHTEKELGNEFFSFCWQCFRNL